MKRRSRIIYFAFIAFLILSEMNASNLLLPRTVHS